MCIDSIAAPEVMSLAGAGACLIRAPVPEAIREMAASVPLHLLEVCMPVKAGSRPAENWHLAVEIDDRFGIVCVVAAVIVTVAVFRAPAATVRLVEGNGGDLVFLMPFKDTGSRRGLRGRCLPLVLANGRLNDRRNCTLRETYLLFS